MSEFRIRAKASAVFVRPIEQFDDGVMKGEVRSAGKNAVNHFWIGDIVIYLLDDTLTEFTEPGSGQKMHAVYYYKVLGIYEKIEKRKKAVECEKLEDKSFSFNGFHTF